MASGEFVIIAQAHQNAFMDDIQLLDDIPAHPGIRSTRRVGHKVRPACN